MVGRWQVDGWMDEAYCLLSILRCGLCVVWECLLQQQVRTQVRSPGDGWEFFGCSMLDGWMDG